ncbi:MAG: right-handed parallel beta-helix repeat-containing protein [Candidatus Hydrogenedentes bacterium]|nr:right-handed parallel beta-helix repeat-containing protein [Candidatus Hydrogenedentota bacterium]
MRTMVTIILALGFLAVLSEAETFYLSPSGNDANPGTEAAPFATLEKARDAARTAKSSAKDGVSVVIAGGVYTLDKPVVFTPEDSGTAERPVKYVAKEGEQPVFRGGRTITGWKRAEGDLWTVEIPEVKAGTWYFRQLFVNGERRPRTKLPQDGYYTIAGGGTPPKRSFKFNAGEINPAWKNLNDVEVIVLQFWTEARLRIASIDTATNMVVFTGDAFRPLDWNKGWYVENVREALNTPGQWYLDRATGVLTYWAKPGEDLEKVEVVAPVSRYWMRFEGDAANGAFVDHLTFEGLHFEYSDWRLDDTLGYSYPQAAIDEHPNEPLFQGWPEGDSIPQSQIEVPAGIFASGARNTAFMQCEFAHTGAWAMDWQTGCKDIAVSRSHFYDLGAGGIRVGSPKIAPSDALETSRVTIEDCRIHDGVRVYQGAPAIWIGQSSDNTVAHNEIYGPFEWAISVGWNWGYTPPNRARDNKVEFNHVHDLGDSPLGTHGAIYSLGVQPGTVIRNNHIHDIRGGGSGIVLDNASVGVLVEDNVVHHCSYSSFMSNFNDLGNMVFNNVFAMATKDQLHRIGDVPADRTKIHQTGVFFHNIFYWDTGTLFESKDWVDYNIIMENNLYFDATGAPVTFCSFSFDEWKAKGLDQHSLVADPLFVNPAGGDFSLKPESPAFQLGHKAIDMRNVGPRFR